MGNACAGVVGPESTATVPPAQTPASPKTARSAAGAGTASVASVSARTLEPRDPPVNDVLPVVTPVTLNGKVSPLFCPFMDRFSGDQSSNDIL